MLEKNQQDQLCLSQFQLGTSPRATPGDSLKTIIQGVGIWLLKVARGPGIRQGLGFCGSSKRHIHVCSGGDLCTRYEGWFGCKDFPRQGSIYWGAGEASPPQKKSFS